MSTNRLSEYFFDVEIDGNASALNISRATVREDLLSQIQDEAFEELKGLILAAIAPIERRLKKPFGIVQLGLMANRQFECLQNLLEWVSDDHRISDIFGRTKREVQRHGEQWKVFVEKIISELRAECIRHKANDYEISFIYGTFENCFETYSMQKDGLKDVLLAIQERIKNEN